MSDHTIFQVQTECPTERAVLSTLLYFEFFSYPLTEEEVWAYSGVKIDPDAVSAYLNSLCAQGLAFEYEGFFQSVENPDWVAERLACNRRAAQFMPMARRMARFIGAFPFVRSVYVSGSLSKNSIRPDGDIDFFVITAPGRLWLARTLLILFKKILLFNSHKYFCVNYFIDTEHLEIEEKNLFTAMEIVTLLPMYDTGRHDEFMRVNAWARQYYPNFPSRTPAPAQEAQEGLFKLLVERMLSGKVGAWLDARAMRLTVSYWKRKFSHFDPQTFDSALKSRQYVSKHHPLRFQKRVLEAFELRLMSLFSKDQ